MTKLENFIDWLLFITATMYLIAGEINAAISTVILSYVIRTKIELRELKNSIKGDR